MKVRPKNVELLLNEEDYEDFGITVSWMPSSKNSFLRSLQAEQLIFEDDLYDLDIETETKHGKEFIIPKITQALDQEELLTYKKAIKDIEDE